MKKTLLAILLAVLLALSVPLSAFAAGGLVQWNTNYVDLTSCQVYRSGYWSAVSANFTTEEGTNRGVLSIPFVSGSGSTGFFPSQWRALFTPNTNFPSYVVPERFLQLDLNINYWQDIASSTYYPQTITGALYVTSSDGTIFEFPITEQTEIKNGVAVESYLLSIGGVADVGEGFDLKGCTFEFVANGYSNATGVTLYFGNLDFSFVKKFTDDTVQIVDTVEQGFADLQDRIEQGTQDIIDNQNQNTQDIIDNQNSNTQDIIDNNNANTDKITGSIEDSTDDILNNDLGYETPDEVDENKNMIQTLTSQVNVINTKVNDAKNTIDEGAEYFCTGAEDFGDFINQFFAKLPTAFTFLIFGLIIFLVLRKVVGR